MATDKIRKYVLPNIPYLFIGWFCLKIGTAYRLAAGAGFGEKLLGLGRPLRTSRRGWPPLTGWWALWVRWRSGC